MQDPNEPKSSISGGRITIWVVVGAVALYMIVSGVLGIISNGG
ncbi:hypothetical protein [Microbacterium thalassium]|uniref:Uncharacterized protein n=1 Tax=Microbacterium thalassium TaxID=362649 RepID=A0A7X0FLN3_9MICO|nr:hypothetical protein [Microbacterium thalassium]MBB6389825.1 hypothetical protein [Microbacterium thalassium]